MPRPLVSLDDSRATHVDVVGAKAASLARARAAGLPTMPGLVVPTEMAVRTLTAGQRALDDVGRGRARVAALAVPFEGSQVLRSIRELGERLVVRSSSDLDDDGAWSGAFASYGDVAPDELERVVTGCWASAFAPDTLARFDQTGRRPADVRLAVLIQPHLRMDHGGWARIADDHLEIAAVPGHPGPLLSGQVSGRRAVVPLRGGRAGFREELHWLPPDAVTALRRSAVRLRDELGADRLEWGFADGGLTLLQVAATRTAETAPALAAGPDDGRYGAPEHAALARALVGRRGPLADRLLTPWAAVIPRCEPTPAIASGHRTADDAATLLRLAARLDEAASDAVGLPVDEFRDLLAMGETPPIGRPVGPGLARMATRLIASVESIAAILTDAGALPSRDAIWWQDEAWLIEASLTLDASVRLPPARARTISDRWDELRFGVARAAGTLHAGQPAASGRGAGRARWVEGPGDATELHAGDVLIVAHPSPALAPLVWDRGGVVAASGSAAAHLCEVARSVHVPMVVGVVAPPRAGAIVALDGDAGQAWSWRP